METFRASAFLAICSLLTFFLYGSVANDFPHFCPGQTPCQYGCCPLANGTCCSDGMQCCPQGSICLPSRRLCIQPRNPIGAAASISTSPVTLKGSEDQDAIPCPPNTTSCGQDKCCFFRDGTCCEDGLHCCPYNYKCDLSQQRCYMIINNELTNNLDDDYDGTAVTPLFRSLVKSPHKTCPGGVLDGDKEIHCPSYSSCCSDERALRMSCCWDPFQPGHGHFPEENPATETVW